MLPKAIEQEMEGLGLAASTDLVVIDLQTKVQDVLHYARIRTIGNLDDVEAATNDLTIIGHLTKTLKGQRDLYLVPIERTKDQVKAVFNSISEPLEEARTLTRTKLLAFQVEQDRLRAEAEAITKMRAEAEKRAKELLQRTGEIIDKEPETPIASIPETSTFHAGLGTSSVSKNRKWRLIDIARVPREYMKLDESKVGRVIRAGGDIPGIEAYIEPSLRIAPNKPKEENNG